MLIHTSVVVKYECNKCDENKIKSVFPYNARHV